MEKTFFVTPKMACVDHQTGAPVIGLKVGHRGFWPIFTRATIEQLNDGDVTPEILQSAVIGSMFGWEVPGAALAIAYAHQAAKLAG